MPVQAGNLSTTTAAADIEECTDGRVTVIEPALDAYVLCREKVDEKLFEKQLTPVASESVASSEALGRRVALPVCKGLTEFDRDGDGFIDEREIEAFARKLTSMVHKMKFMRRLVLILSCTVFFLLSGMFAMTYLASQLAKDMHVQDSEIVGGDHQVLSTVPKLDRLDGVQYMMRRRLAASNETLPSNGTPDGNETHQSFSLPSDNQTGEEDITGIEIKASSFREAFQAYKKGKASWIVGLPDGTTRTIAIYGVTADGAWGWCPSCSAMEKIAWQVHCDDGLAAINSQGNLGALHAQSACIITWTILGEGQASDESMSFTQSSVSDSIDRRRALRGEAVTPDRDEKFEELMRAAQALQLGIAQLRSEAEIEKMPSVASAASLAHPLLARAGRTAGIRKPHRNGPEAVDRALSGKNCV